MKIKKTIKTEEVKTYIDVPVFTLEMSEYELGVLQSLIGKLTPDGSDSKAIDAIDELFDNIADMGISSTVANPTFTSFGTFSFRTFSFDKK